MDIASVIDHTELQPSKPLARYTDLCREAVQFKFHSVCVSSFHTPLVSNLLHAYVHTDMNLNIKVVSTIGFPSGICNIESKIAEMKQAFNDGASEFDFVANLSAIRTGDWKRFKDELVILRNVIPTTDKFHPILKCILEVGLLEDSEIQRACDIIVASKIDFCKTSTGFLAKLEPKQTARYVKLIADQVKDSPVKVKASGGIKTYDDCLLMVSSGASRIGTSNSVNIMQEYYEKNKKI
jgi:deoxyribose-phosphate aldolase